MKSVIKLAVTIVAVIGMYFSIPFAAKLYLSHKYNVGAKSANWNGLCLEFRNVNIKTESIIGQLDSVVVSFYKEIAINGGEVLVIEKPSPSLLKGNRPYSKLIANNLKITTTYNGYNIKAADVSYVDEGIVGANHVVINENINLYDVTCMKQSKYCSVRYGDGTYESFEFEFSDGIFNKGKINIDYVSIYHKESFIKLEEIEFYNDNISVKNAVIFNKEISADPLTSSNIDIIGFDHKNKLSEFEVYISGSRFVINPYHGQISGNELCQNWIDSLPKEMLTNELSQVKFSGNIKFNIKLYPEPSISISQNCRLTKVPEFIKKLSTTFDYIAYRPNKSWYIRKTGPGSIDWIGLEDLPLSFEPALTTFEDPSFRKHSGIIPKAFEVCLKNYLNNGRRCGGSTISMQLAKNLWLTREQSISRKVQEMFLTFAIESSLSKDQILEMYANIVEFGPDIYGIFSASQKLNKYPADLTTGESACLVSRLPKPSSPISCTEQQQKWVLKVLSQHGKLTKDELEQEMNVF